MQMRVDKLRVTLQLLQPVIPRKPTLAILKNVLLKDGKAMATDMETYAILDLPEAEGECLIPHRSVLELLKYVPGNELLTLECQGKTIALTWDGGKASYDVDPPADYPGMSEIKVKAEGKIDGDNFIAALTSMVGYCATEENRPLLTGVTFSLGETTEVCAGDGFRMAYQVLPISFPAEERVTIPAHSVQVLGALWAKIPRVVPLADSLVRQITAKQQLEFTFGEGKVVVRFGNTTLSSKLIDGSAPHFRKLIPKDPTLRVNAFAPELERATRRIKDIALKGTGIIKLIWTDRIMTVSAKDGDNEAEAKVAVQTDGGAGRVAINVKYLLEYLAGKEGMLTIGVTNEDSPVLLRHGKTPLVVIMPMHADWGDPVPAKSQPAAEAVPPVPEKKPEEVQTPPSPIKESVASADESPKTDKPKKQRAKKVKA
jgi:DNA polymerase-3 subunit beta